ncbi:MAG: hypothetical protein JWM36_4347 [Hyphomicrobiales bacterium]|nr:hypothetical protein [Hyphomicrobiales bacterium]
MRLGLGLTLPFLPWAAAGSALAAGPALSLPFSTMSTGADLLAKGVTFSRPGLATQYDSTGKLTWAPNNLLLWSNDFTNAAWTKSTVTVAAGIADPDGGTNAFTVTATAGGAFIYQRPSTSGNHIASVWARVRTKTGLIELRTPANTSVPLEPTSSWQRLSTLSANVASPFLIVFLANSGDQVDLYEAQLEAVTYQTTPRPYVATTSAAYYGPRFDFDPVTLAAKGLLIEESRTNVVLNSADHSTASWTKFNSPVTANAAIAPDGTLTASKMIEAATTGQHAVFNASGFPNTAATAYTASTYLKAGERTWALFAIEINGTSYGKYVNLTTGAIGGVAGNAPDGFTVENDGNGWWRISATKTSVGTASGFCSVYMASADGVASYSGDGTSGIYRWGSQYETGSFATSLIFTQNASVTRAADSASITGPAFSSIWNPLEGTIVIEGEIVKGGAYSFSVDDNTANNRMLVYHTGTGLDMVANSGGPLIVNNTLGAYNLAAHPNFKAAFTYKVNDYAGSLNGAAAVVGTPSGAVPPVTQMRIGGGGTGTESNGHVKSFSYYRTRFPNAQLVTLTT